MALKLVLIIALAGSLRRDDAAGVLLYLRAKGVAPLIAIYA
jgi:hypothetical protein